MKFINQGSVVIGLILGFSLGFLLPETIRIYYVPAFFTIAFFGLAVLLHRYQRIDLVAGVIKTERNPQLISTYVGRLLYLTSVMLALATILSLLDSSLFASWYMIIFAIPILFYAGICLVKINGKGE